MQDRSLCALRHALTVQLWLALQLGSQSEPDLNAARRRRKRGSKKVKKVKNGALGPREEIHRSNCACARLVVYKSCLVPAARILMVLDVGVWMRSRPNANVQPTGALRWRPIDVDWRASGERKAAEY